MAQRTDKTEPGATPASGRFSKMLSLGEVREILNVGAPTLYALLRSGELRGVQIGGRGYLAQSRGSMPFLPGAPGQRVSFR